MKLRILDDSLRLRLSRDEVEHLGAGQAVQATTHFPGGTEFSYELRAGGAEISAGFSSGGISVVIPVPAVGRWASDDSEVSIRGEVESGGHLLSILIEKDFECLEPREGESQSNRFPNPKK